MIKNICNSELFVPKKRFKYKIVVAIFMGVAVLPLPVMAEGEDKPLIVKVDENNPNPEITIEKDIATIQNTNKENSPTITDSYTVDAKSNTANEPSDKNIINNGTSGNNAAASTAALDNVDALSSDNTKELLVKKQPGTAKKTPFWKNTNYLLSGGLIFLILGGALLSFLKISRLSDENEKLEQQNQRLRKEAGNALNKLKQSNIKNAELESTLKQQLNINNDYKSNAIDTFGAVLPIMDTEEPLVIEDLNASDRNQLSDSITTWFQKNRGNMNIRDLVSVEIQKKLDHWQYSIELWTQSDGVDSIELAQNTMRASVISLTKPDRRGFAYCFKKPNALSTVWVNKGWYEVQRTNSTLEVSSKPLEIN